MEKSTKVEKNAFDAVLKRIVSANAVKASEIKTPERKPLKIIPATRQK